MVEAGYCAAEALACVRDDATALTQILAGEPVDVIGTLETHKI
jgi:hypothetical protein